MHKRRKWVLALIFIIAGLICLLGSAHINTYTDMTQNKSIIFNNVFLSIANILLFTGAWNALHSSPTAEEILEAAQLPKNFQDSGIVKIYETFTEIEWSKYFKKAKHVVFFFTYASNFTNKNLRYLEKLKKKKKAITVIVPDYNNDTMMDFFDRSFKYGKYSENLQSPLNSTKNRILETISVYRGMNAEILLYPGEIKSTYYFFDDICVYAPFNHCKDKKYVPAIVSEKGGKWYEFCEMDIKEIIKQSTKREG